MASRYNSASIFGAEIQYFRLDPRYWETVVDRFKDSGLSTVTTYVQWATHLVGPPDKANPAGMLDFEGRTSQRLNLKHFLDIVAERGLSLNFRTGPFCCNEMVHGAYPEWIVMGDPNTMVWDYQNRTTQGYWIGKREGSQPSYLHPEYLDWCRKWIEQVDAVVRPYLSKYGGPITMVNIDNEVSYIVQDGFLSSDYNPINVGPGGFYHQFLQEKYTSPDALPYGNKYDTFDDVPAPRFIPEHIGEGFAYYADWGYFKEWVMAKYISNLRDMHISNGIEGVTFMTNFNPHRPEGVPTRMPTFEKATGGIAGYDFYRGTFMSYSGYQSMARVLKLMNATLKYTWSAEFMSGTWNKVLTSRVSDDHMRFMARCALAHGCKAISWFMFHDRDCWGDAPVSSHGHIRPSLEVLRETMALFSGSITQWDEMKALNDIGIVYDLTSVMHAYLGDPSPCADNELWIGEPYVDNVASGRCSQEYEGLYRLAEHVGRQAAAIDVEYDDTPLTERQYPVVMVPGSPVMGTKTLNAVKSYVELGGVVILTGAWPARNETGQRISFCGLAAAPDIGKIKIRQGELHWHAEWLAAETAESDPIDSIDWLETVLNKYTSASHCVFKPESTVSWIDWRAGGAMKSEGGHCVYEQPRNLLSSILHKAPSGESIIFLLNHYPEAVLGRLELAIAARKLVCLDTGQGIEPTPEGNFRVDLDRKSCRIFRVEC